MWPLFIADLVQISISRVDEVELSCRSVLDQRLEDLDQLAAELLNELFLVRRFWVLVHVSANPRVDEHG